MIEVSRLARTAAGMLALLGLVVSCDDGDDPVELSGVVLRDDEITDDPQPSSDILPRGSEELYEVYGCAVDDDFLFLDLRDRDINYVVRVAPDGDDEDVTVGAFPAPLEVRHEILRTVARQVQAARCIERPGQHDQLYTGTISSINGLPDGAVGFRNGMRGWSRDSDSDPWQVKLRRSMMAAYAPVGDYLVFVMLSHFDGTDPEVADLRELLDKAIAKVEDND
jgi:hypothetical protein